MGKQLTDDYQRKHVVTTEQAWLGKTKDRGVSKRDY